MSFDAFGQTDDFREDVFFGEVIVTRGFQAIWLYDIDPDYKGWIEYEAENELHKKALATPTTRGKQRNLSVCFEVQHFPEGMSFDTFPNVWPVWGDDWKTFEGSLAKIVNADITTKNKLGEFRNVHLRKLSETGNYFKYKTPVMRTYEKDGVTKSIRGIELIEWYKSVDECMAAYKANNGKLSEPSKVEEKVVEAMPREQALQFVVSLAKQIEDTPDCWNDLQTKLNEFPMLGGLKVDEEDVKQAAENASDVFKVEF